MPQALSLGHNRTYPSNSLRETFHIEFEWYRFLSADPRRTLCRSCSYSYKNSASRPSPLHEDGSYVAVFGHFEISPLENLQHGLSDALFNNQVILLSTCQRWHVKEVKQFLKDFMDMQLPSPPFPPPPELLCAICSSCVFRPEILRIVRRARILLAKKIVPGT